MLTKNKKIILLVVLVCLLTISFAVWYSFFDTLGMRFYNQETIVDMIPYSNQIYMVDSEGNVFLTGGHEKTGNRKYRNAEFIKNDALGCFSPVLIFEKNASIVLPYDDLCALIITHNGELYNFSDFELSDCIAVNVSFAFCDKIGGTIYYVDDSGGFYQAGVDESIYNGVKKSYEYNGAFYLLKTSNELVKISKNNDHQLELLFKDVVDFSLLDTSVRLINGKVIYDDPSAVSTPLITVLTENGDLYVKGAYNHLSCGMGRVAPPIKIITEWSLIDSNVNDYSTSEIGTIYTKHDGTICYYGFDSVQNNDGNFKQIVLDLDHISTIYANQTVVCASSEGKFYVWGDGFALVFDRLSDKHGILTGTAVEISP